MFVVAAILGLLICVGNEFHIGETSDCLWEVAITTSLNPCTNSSLMLTDNPENIIASLGIDQAKRISHRLSFLGKLEPFDQSLLARIKCKTVEESRARSRTYALAGGKVNIILRQRALFGQSVSGDQYVGKQYNAAMIDISENPGCSSNGKCFPAVLCDPVWIIPVYHESSVLMIIGMMEDKGTGQILPMPRNFIAEVTGLMPNVTNHKDADLTPLQTGVVSLLHMPHVSSFVTLGGFDNASTLLLSQTEFEKVVISTLEDVYPEVSTGKPVCECDIQHDTSRLYAIGSLSDRHLLLTSIGLIEVYGNLTYLNDTSSYHKHNTRPRDVSYERLTVTRPDSVVAYTRCAHKMLLPVHETGIFQYVVLTGACQDKGRLFVACIVPKFSSKLKFTELLPPDGKSLDSLFTAPSHIIATAQSAVSGGRFFALHQTSQAGLPVYAVTMTMRHSGVTSNELLSIIPQQIPSSILDEPLMLSQALLIHNAPMEKVDLRGMSTTSQLSGHLFLWGSRILHSPDFGHTFYLLPAYSPSKIVLFETSRRGQLVFLTAKQEIFVGITAISKITKIWPTNAWDIAHARHNLPILPPHAHIFTIFFDQQDDIKLLYMSTNGTPSTVKKHSVPFADILTLLAFEELWMTEDCIFKEQGKTRMFLEVKHLCPFRLIKFIITDIKTYTKLQELMYYPPYVVYDGRVNWHHNRSVLLYHSTIRKMTSVLLTFHSETYTSTSISPIDRWKTYLAVPQPYFKYIFQTQRRTNPEYIHADQIQLIQHKIVETTKLPDVIYLDLNDAFHFEMMAMPSQRGNWESLQIGVLVTNSTLISVDIKENWDIQMDMMTYEVVVHHQGTLDRQSRPGTGLNVEYVQLFFHGAPLHCYCQSEKHAEPRGIQQLSVMLGCPPNLHVLFDWNATKQKLNDDDIQQTPIDCLYPDPNLPCFYFDNGFYPIFRVFDDTIFSSWIFEGNYTMKVVGGSSEHETIRNFTEDEIFKYNNKRGSHISLIWSGNDDLITDNGWDMYNVKQNGIRWLCQPKSPCSGAMPHFPRTPEFFLVIEFSNRDVDKARTNCDFTFTFVVHLHGLPIDAVSTSLVIVGVGVGLICLYLLVYFLVYCRHRSICYQMQIYYHTRVKPFIQTPNPEELQNTLRLLYARATPIIVCDSDSEDSKSGMQFNQVPSPKPDLAEVQATDASNTCPMEGEGDTSGKTYSAAMLQSSF